MQFWRWNLPTKSVLWEFTLSRLLNTLNRILVESLRLWTQHCWRKLMFILQVSTAMFANLDISCMMTSPELTGTSRVSRENIVDPYNHCFINVLKVPWIICCAPVAMGQQLFAFTLHRSLHPQTKSGYIVIHRGSSTIGSARVAHESHCSKWQLAHRFPWGFCNT